MLILELTKFSETPEAQTNVAPFVYQSYPGRHTTADYWQTAFGCPDESVTTSIYVSSFVQASILFYNLMTTLADCIAQAISFYFLVLTEILYVHYQHDSNPWSDVYELGDQISVNDTMDIYIDNVYCAALLLSVPSIAQQQDLVNYDRLALKSGTAVLNNVSDPFTKRGRLDDLITRKLYGNDARLYFLDSVDGIFDYSRSDLVDQAAFTIDDYDISLQQIPVKLLDKRGAQDIMIPFDLFSQDDYPDIDEKWIGKTIPFGYGLIRANAGIPTNSLATGDDVVFRQALMISSLGTVQVKVDEEWVTVVPVDTDLMNGEFTVDSGDGRNAQGVPYACRVLGSVLIENDHASDCIKDLNERFLGILFTGSAYDRTEWNIEQSVLAPVGILWNKQVKLFDAIKDIQNGANVGFRYEINASGRRTIRIDDNNRTVSRTVTREDIHNITELPVKSHKELLASVVKVNYAHDYVDDADYFIQNEDNIAQVLSGYRQVRKLVELKTSLTTEEDAEERGAYHAGRYNHPPKVLEAELRGRGFYNLRIFDIIEIEITPALVEEGTARILEGREYYGIWKTKVVGTDPKFGELKNVCDMQLIEKIEAIDYIMADHSGPLLSFGSEGTAVILWGGRGA